MLDDWDNVAVLQRGRERMHTPLGAYPDWESARARRRGDSPYILSLNGEWRFCLVDAPAAAPAGFAESGFDDSAWGCIAVPGNWQLRPDSPDRPLYTNIKYPFDAAPPHPPATNPTGCYRREFDLPDAWRGRSVFLVIESADSACKVWLNGREVGYSQDSRLPAEFEATPFLKPGVNTLAVLVPRWCDGSYLEDQDFWHLSGLQRDVFLIAKPTVHLRDYAVRTTFPDGDFAAADLLVAAALGHPKRLDDALLAGYSIETMLYDVADRPVFDAPARAQVSAESPMYGAGSAEERGSARLVRRIERPRLWSAETPALYTLVIALIDPDGAAVDFESVRVGFRQVEIKERVLRLNGERLLVRGVNRHEHHPLRGRAVTEADMRADIVAMKRLNFNAARTSHYPNHPLWYELCDELGLYVVDEANLETHGVGALLSKDPEWLHAYIERAARMAMRDRNHPCIVAWSLGNESSYGPHHAAMAAWLRAFDPTRPVQYESGNPPHAVSDIMAPMYPRLEWAREVLADPGETRPMIFCEYAYAKGNASGDFDTFWELADEQPSFQGGFIWDWADKALQHELPSGETVWGYGGDLGGDIDYDKIGEDPSMVLNGVVRPDLAPHPGAWEIKNVQAPVAFAASEQDLAAGRVVVRNKHQFVDIEGMLLRWQVTEDGVGISGGEAALPSTPPGERKAVDLRLPRPFAGKPDSEHRLNVSCALSEPTPWAPAGHVIAWTQFPLPAPTAPAPDAAAAAATARRPTGAPSEELAIEQSASRLAISGGRARLEFDLADGRIALYQVDGRSLLERGPVEQFWRAPTDNDFAIFAPGNYLQRWKDAGMDRLRRSVDTVEARRLDSGAVEVIVASTLRGADEARGIECIARYRALGDGLVSVELRALIDEAIPVVPRVGLELVLPAGMTRCAWYGRGPHESYPDRKSSALIGRYDAALPTTYEHYIRPGESGGRENVRWARIAGEEGGGLLILGLPEFHFDASHFSVADIDAARHYYELKPRLETFAHIDGRHMGVGGDDGWTPNVHPQFLISPGEYFVSFALAPAAVDLDEAQALWSEAQRICADMRRN